MENSDRKEGSSVSKDMGRIFLKLCGLFIPLYFSVLMYYTLLDSHFKSIQFDMLWIDNLEPTAFEFLMVPFLLVLSILGMVSLITENKLGTMA
ncbi:MAG: hypothetical protein SVJ22_03025 [Halobacteriota archaeon]|nr:hypothetical protein [Halobacteriota archaeon]